jgi:putative transcriptional regulator
LTPKELQELLTSRREQLGLTQQDVVDKSQAGITRQYYGMIENGERRPSVEVAKRIAPVLGIQWTIFFELIGNQKLLKSNSA